MDERIRKKERAYREFAGLILAAMSIIFVGKFMGWW